jgi:hypothetical protein
MKAALVDKPRNQSDDRIAVARRKAFYRGLRDGFSGPWMMGSQASLSRALTFELKALEVLDRLSKNEGVTQAVFRRALDRALLNALGSGAIRLRIEENKELQQDGKLRSIERLILSLNGREEHVSLQEWQPSTRSSSSS